MFDRRRTRESLGMQNERPLRHILSSAPEPLRGSFPRHKVFDVVCAWSEKHPAKRYTVEPWVRHYEMTTPRREIEFRKMFGVTISTAKDKLRLELFEDGIGPIGPYEISFKAKERNLLEATAYGMIVAGFIMASHAHPHGYDDVIVPIVHLKLADGMKGSPYAVGLNGEFKFTVEGE